MNNVKKLILVVACVVAAFAQSVEPPLSDTRLSIHTLVREDIFAGFLVNDMERFSRGEKNVQLLLEQRPAAKAELLAWLAGATLYRSVLDYEAKRMDEFKQKYSHALDLFAQAKQLGPKNGGVAAVTGGSYVLFADRVPKEHQAQAWNSAYDAYQVLWKQQAAAVDKLPVHISGELLGGLAQSAQRTGKTEELKQYLDKIIEVMKDTPYERIAKKWKENPKSAADSSITCMTCHEQGRLAAHLNRLNPK